MIYQGKEIVKSPKQKEESEEIMENDSDKLFLLSLLQNFRMTPASRKPSVKIAIINAISNGLYSPSLPPFVLSSHYAPSIPYNAHQPEYMYSTYAKINNVITPFINIPWGSISPNSNSQSSSSACYFKLNFVNFFVT